MAGSTPRCAAHSQAHKAESFALEGSPTGYLDTQNQVPGEHV